MAAMVVGLAMLAMPITAAAKDYNYNYNNNAHASRASHSYVAPARNNSPAVATGRYVRNGSTTFASPPRMYPAHDGRAWGNAYDYRHYGRSGYYGAPVYGTAAPVYAAPAYVAPAYPVYGGYGSGGCGAARSVMYNYQRDRNTGHPAAAYDLLRQNQWAFHSGCGAAAPYAGGMLGGFGGGPAYGGPGYGQPYGGGGSMLAPLIQQFVR